MSKIIVEGARLLALFLLVAYVFSFAASYFWFADLFRHFVLQYFIGATVLFFIFVTYRSKIWATVMLFTLCACFLEIIIVTPQAHSGDRHDHFFKIAHYNKLFLMDNQHNIKNWVAFEQPDILVIQEADIATLKIAQTFSGYPYNRFQIYEDNPFGFILLSKHPIEAFDMRLFENKKIENPYFRTVINLPRHDITVFSAHPVPPVDYVHSAQRNQDIAVKTDFISQDTSENIISLGDFNITPYSPRFKDMLLDSGLKNEYTSSFMPPTWPSGFIDYIFQIPIDHILHKGNLDLIDKRRGPHFGSDHYSLIATYGLR